MSYLMKRFIMFVIVFIVLVPLIFYGMQYLSRATATKANLVINTKKITGLVYPNWQAIAQGGEEKGVQMFGNVVPQLRELSPKYIRLDHIYDYYNVVSRDGGQLTFNFAELDKTVCDIYATGAKPFFALSYTPETMSADGTIIGRPSNWNEWSLLVQKTIEHYSGRGTVLCNGTVSGEKLSDIYYEVWNEPDLFGKWSLYGGDKDYKTLYFHSAQGAQNAKDVHLFALGGPGITAAYKNWFQVFLKYVQDNRLRIDFVSWHHYTKDPDDYVKDVQNIDSWIPQTEYGRFSAIPKLITEWGYDSEPNQIADTNVGAAYTIASIRNLVDQKVKYAFSFEAKDGPTPRWGILSYTGQKKPRFQALKFLNILGGKRVQIDGEGTYVRAIGSVTAEKTSVIIVNYDKESKNTELVPITFANLTPGSYDLKISYLSGQQSQVTNIPVTGTSLQRNVLLQPNMVAAVELIKR